jgi:hypothetical protein
MKHILPSLIVIGLLTSTGCARVSPEERRVLTGGGIGAAGGAALGALAGGNPAVGAALGGLTGSVAGALWDDVDRVQRGY